MRCYLAVETSNLILLTSSNNNNQHIKATRKLPTLLLTKMSRVRRHQQTVRVVKNHQVLSIKWILKIKVNKISKKL